MGVALAVDLGYCFDPPALVGGAVQRLRCGGRISRRKNRLSLRWPGAACASLSMQNRLLPWAKRTFHFISFLSFFFFSFLWETGGGGTYNNFEAEWKKKKGECIEKKNRERNERKTNGEEKGRWKASLGCRKHLVSYLRTWKEIANRQNSYVLIYFLISWLAEVASR